MTIGSGINFSTSQWQSYVNSLDPFTRMIVTSGAGDMLKANPAEARRLGVEFEQVAGDSFEATGAPGKRRFNVRGQVSPNEEAKTSPPSQAYSQAELKAGKGYASTGYVALRDEDIVSEKGQTWKQLRGVLDRGLASSNPRVKATAETVMKNNGIVKMPDGEWVIKSSALVAGGAGSTGSGATAPGGAASGDGATDGILGWMGRNSGLAMTGAGLLTGGIGGAAAGFFANKMIGGSQGMQQITGALTGAMGMTMGSGVTGIGMGGLGAAAGVAQMAGLDGMAFQLRKVMRSVAEDYKDNALIGMINNPGIPIEQLIMIFMIHMADKYEVKLREKMEEAAMAEKRERKREMRTQMAGALGGIASLFGPVGMFANTAINAGMAKWNEMEAGLNGQSKSQTMLMQEVQILVNNWKMLQELVSNLSKSLHDMAMTPVRNLR